MLLIRSYLNASSGLTQATKHTIQIRSAILKTTFNRGVSTNKDQRRVSGVTQSRLPVVYATL